MRGFFNRLRIRLRIRFASPLSSNDEWYIKHLLYQVGDVVRLRTTNTVGYGNRIYEALIIETRKRPCGGCKDVATYGEASYGCLRLDTGEVEYHFKWNLEHHFKRVRRKVQITDIMSLEEGLTHENEYIRSLACAC